MFGLDQREDGGPASVPFLYILSFYLLDYLFPLQEIVPGLWPELRGTLTA